MPAKDRDHAHQSTPHTHAIRRLTGKVALRVGTQRGLSRALWVGGGGAIATAVVLFMVQRLWIAPTAVTPTLAIWGAATLTAFMSGFFRRASPIALVARIDVANGLHSDLSNALALAAAPAPRSGMAEVAVARGVASAATANWRLAAPWRGAIATRAVALAVIGAVIFFVTALGTPTIGTQQTAFAIASLSDPGLPQEPDKLTLNEAAVETLENLKEPLLAPETENDQAIRLDERVRGAVDSLDALVQAVLDGKLSQEEAFARLAELEGDLTRWQDGVGGDLGEVQERVAEAAKTRLEDKRQASEALKDMLDALRKKAWPEAASAAEEAAKKLADGSLDKREQERLAKSLEKLAADLQTEHAKKDKALREEEDRLKAKQEATPNKMTAKEKERLKEIEREMESLEREEKEVSEAMRQLAELAREYEDLARELMKRFKFKGGSGDSGDSGGKGASQQNGPKGEKPGEGDGGSGGPEDALRRAANMIREIGSGQKSREEAEEAINRIERIRDALKEGGQSGPEVGAPEPGQNGPKGEEAEQAAQGPKGAGGEGEPGQGGAKAAQGGAPGEGSGGSKPGESQGKPGQPGAGGEEGQGGDKSAGKGSQPGSPTLGQGPEQGPGDKGELAQGDKGPGAQEGQMGDEGKKGASLGNGPAGGQNQPKVGTGGVGTGHDSTLLGDKTELSADGKAEFVPGVLGEGASTSNIVEVAAQRGFATAGYEEVLQDYRNVAEDALKRELIPAGKRGYVRRYFDLIKPR